MSSLGTIFALLSSLAAAHAAQPDAPSETPAQGAAPTPEAPATDAPAAAPATEAKPVEPKTPAEAPAPAPLPAPAPPPEPETKTPLRVDEMTAVGTRESRTAGSAHILKSKDLERLNLDNPEQVVKAVPGVYSRGEDAFGLRPNIGIRGTNPDRSKKVTLMEDGILFGPAPYSAPAAYYFPIITRMDAVRVIKGPGAVVFGPQTVGGAIDLVTRPIPLGTSGGIDAAFGQYDYGKLHGFYGDGNARTGYVLEGVHLRTDGFKEIDGGGDTGFVRNEWMWKGRHLLSEAGGVRQEVGLKLGYSDEDSNETYLGLSDADYRAKPYRRYASTRLDQMRWHRTQTAATYHADFTERLALDVALYRNDLSRSWNRVKTIDGRDIGGILANPTAGLNAYHYAVLSGTEDSSGGVGVVQIGPNDRDFVSQGIQGRLTYRGDTGPVAHRAELGVRYHYDRIDRLHTEQGFLMRGGRLVPAGTPTITTDNNRMWANALAIWAIDAVTWKWLTLTPGVRAELISTEVRDRLAGKQGEGDPQRVVMPSIGAYAALTPSFGVLAGAYSGFSPAAPTLTAGVKPERSVNYEGGLRWTSRALRVEGIGFFNDYSNLTSVCTFSTCGPNLDDAQFNAGRAYIYGAELFASGQVRLGKGYALPFLASYTYTKTELRDQFTSDEPTLGKVEPGYELPYVPRHQAFGMLGVDGPRAGVTLAVTYTSPMREQAGTGEIPAGLRTDEQLFFDANLYARVHASGQVYLSARNLFGDEALAARRPFGARPIGPRWLMLGTRWTF